MKDHPQGNVFQTPEMYLLYQHAQNITPYIVAVVNNGQVEGILLAQWMSNGNKLAQWITSRSIISGGPLAKDNDPTIIDLLLKAYNKLLPVKTIYSEIRPIYDSAVLFQYLSTRKWTRKGHYNILLSLNKDEETLYNQMHKERKRNVQTAIKNGLTFQEVTMPKDIKNVVALIQQTYARKHVPISYLDMFDKVLDDLKVCEFDLQMIADDKDTDIGVSFMLRSIIYSVFIIKLPFDKVVPYIQNT